MFQPFFTREKNKITKYERERVLCSFFEMNEKLAVERFSRVRLFGPIFSIGPNKKQPSTTRIYVGHIDEYLHPLCYVRSLQGPYQHTTNIPKKNFKLKSVSMS